MRPQLRSLFFTLRATALRRIPLYHGLIQMKWCLRAALGFKPRPPTVNLHGKLTGKCEGVEPIQCKGPKYDEPFTIWYRLLGTPAKYDDKGNPLDPRKFNRWNANRRISPKKPTSAK